MVTMDSQASIYNEDQGSLPTTKTNLMSSLPNCMLGFTNLNVSNIIFVPNSTYPNLTHHFLFLANLYHSVGFKVQVTEI